MTCEVLGPADCQPGDVESRLSDADRHALSSLPASADSFVQLEIVADHRDARERARTIANQRSALDRIFDLPVFDEVRLRALEDELAGRDIDLTASEINRVNAALQGSEDFARVLVAGGHEGVGHARHRPVGVAFAPARTSRRDAGEARVQAILQIAFENAVFDQHRALSRRAFIVDGERAAPVFERAVIHNCYTGRRDALPDHARKSAGAFTVEVALEPVADGL